MVKTTMADSVWLKLTTIGDGREGDGWLLLLVARSGSSLPASATVETMMACSLRVA
jgi:hypothetical protein